MLPSRYLWLMLTFLFLSLSTAAFAQFTSSVQGVVQDPSGAGVGKANVELVNDATSATETTTTDPTGNFRFVSLVPGTYTVSVEASGFAKAQAHFNLLTEQNLNVPVTLKIGAATDVATVTTAAPVVDTADSRNQLTLQNSGVAQLPVAGRNLVTLTTLAPGVSGLGTMGGGQPGKAGLRDLVSITTRRKRKLTLAPTASVKCRTCT